ncbi:MAG TPA: glycerol-3-phosphate acyltransferase [Anaerolineales bacterium]|nr:glycerol-3-phosphate acyltransferase [Anaerolineales bacterium]
MVFPMLVKEVMVILAGYALGCFAAGYYLVRWRTGQDIRTIGSGATGGTNVGRLLGKPGFAVTMALDLLKGCLAVWAAFYFEVRAWAVALTVAAVVIGHIWPVQLGFQGGKGLATVLGAMLVFDVRLLIVLIILALLLGLLLRQFAIGVLTLAALAPAVAAAWGRPWTDVLGLAVTAAAILIAHRGNIRALLERRSRPTDKG